MILNDVISITKINWKPSRNDQVEGLGSGQVLTAELTTPLWMPVVTSPLTEFDDGRRVRAILNDLTKPGNVFELYDPIAKYPVSDPDGTAIAGNTVQVNSVSGGNMSLKGLDAGYVLKIGDTFQVDYGSAPVRRAYLEMSQDITANGSGITGLFKVFPLVHPGILANDAVSFSIPKMKGIILPGSIDYGVVDTGPWKMMGHTFTVVQKLS